MKRQVSLTFGRGDVYKTTFTNEGIKMYFSISLSTKFGTSMAESRCNILNSCSRLYDNPVYGINEIELFNEEILFEKTPYKNVTKRMYKQKFIFLKVVTFTPYNMVSSLQQVYNDSKDMIYTFINNDLINYANN